jgi:hypothetical protein
VAIFIALIISGMGRGNPVGISRECDPPVWSVLLQPNLVAGIRSINRASSPLHVPTDNQLYHRL